MPHDIDHHQQPVSVERRAYRRDSDDCPPSCRHQLDGIYAHLRHIERDSEAYHQRINEMQARLQASEFRQQEHHAIMTELSGDVSFLKREVVGVHAAIDLLKGRVECQTDLINATHAILTRHTTEEAEHQARQTAAIQRLTRVMLLAASSIGVLVISVATVVGLMGGEMTILSLALQLLGLGGG